LATTFCGVTVKVKFVLPDSLSPSWIVNLIEPDVTVYVVDSHTNVSPAGSASK
jgi:hypothetical protein